MRAVIEYPIFVSRVERRRPDSDPHIFIGRFDENEPPIEVGADRLSARHWLVFHAMMLRLSIAKELGLDRTHPELVRDIAAQRTERKG
ncbi:hypothetical protein KIH27_16685 [Mycobacterium sp. M1]|uniref:Nitrile hydratase beta subunit domain-containing protein n=1 Tax=Mycolicibacter acidiphilus TaxID=2835306 RepID=A0ABS5RLW4_9MYCO|nr:hypothetical protein [Mycolicibacter acidiphilus]MBS9535226.1 hypothetical protein [Mycolicibacter acidiphilus]